jgi:hypothetical protein
MKLKFAKYQATGNDFIIIHNDADHHYRLDLNQFIETKSLTKSLLLEFKQGDKEIILRG